MSNCQNKKSKILLMKIKQKKTILIFSKTEKLIAAYQGIQCVCVCVTGLNNGQHKMYAAFHTQSAFDAISSLKETLQKYKIPFIFFFHFKFFIYKLFFFANLCLLICALYF